MPVKFQLHKIVNVKKISLFMIILFILIFLPISAYCATITITKDNPRDPNVAFSFSASPVICGVSGFNLMHDQSKGPCNLPPGTYIVSEDVKNNYELIGISVSGDADQGSKVNLNNRVISIDLDEGENIVITFKNTKSNIFPNCGFGCQAGDIGVYEIWLEGNQPIGNCQPGPISGNLKVQGRRLFIN